MTEIEGRELRDQDLELARVLLVDDNPTSRLTLQAVLQAGGYFVDCAVSASEAVSLMDHSQYALVMTDLQDENPEASLEVLAHARLMEYQPATAILTTQSTKLPSGSNRPTLVEPQDVPGLLTQVADLISQRAARIVQDGLKPAAQD